MGVGGRIEVMYRAMQGLNEDEKAVQGYAAKAIEGFLKRHDDAVAFVEYFRSAWASRPGKYFVISCLSTV